jgi:hypothetical protein
MVRTFAVAVAAALVAVIGLVGYASAKHQHHAGHLLLGDKHLKDGKHELHRHGEHTIHVHVTNRKITNLTVTHRTKGNVAVKKFKTTQQVVQEKASTKIVDANDQRQVHFVAAGNDQVTQVTTVYYGYAFFDGTDWIIYWFPADYVVVDASWVEYTEAV